MDFWLIFAFLQFTLEHWNSCSHQFWCFPFHLLHPAILALLKSHFLLYFLTDSNSCFPFSSHQCSLLKKTFLCHTWAPLSHNTAPRIPANREIFSLLQRYIDFGFFLKSRCLLRNSHLYLPATNKQQCGIQKILFLKILFNPFLTKEKSLQVGVL